MKTFLLLLFVGVATSAISYSMWGSMLGASPFGPSRPAAQAAYGPISRKLRAQLDRKLPEVRFVKQPISDVFDSLRDVTGADIFINWSALELAGVRRDSPVTVELHDASLSTVLDAILTRVPGGSEPLRFGVDAGVIAISTAEDVNRNTIVRVYNVRNLLPPAATTNAAAQQVASQTLVARLMKEAGAGSWRDNGGTTGAVRELHGQLIVTQTEANQTMVAWYLDRMQWERAWAALAMRSSFVVIPSVALAGLARGLFLCRHRRRAQAIAGSKCLGCGYDLRATPRRCPECGLAVPDISMGPP